MSIIGTGVAASVAQTALNAQQESRKADKGRGERQRAAAQAASEFVKRLNGPADADDAAGELPDRQALGYERLYGPNGTLPPEADGCMPGGAAGDGGAPRSKLDITG